MNTTQIPDVRLEIGGTLYGGWTAISIKRGLEQVAGTFDLEVSVKWPGQETGWPIQTGDPCRVLVDNIPVITGYVDDIDMSYDARAHTYKVTGRDKTADLVDCCPPSTQIKNASLPALARQWAALFGIEVVVQAECNKPVPGFKSDEGDTCFEMLEKLARANGVMLTSDGQGRLVITRAGSTKAAIALRLGSNLLRFVLHKTLKDRFSQVTVKGQSGGSTRWNSGPCAQAKGVAHDSQVPRFRPLTIIAEQEEYGSAATRAQHEVNVRYGKSQSVSVTVNGWYAGAALWQPNVLADIQDVSGHVLETWLIAEVTWRLDAGGWISELTLHPKEAFALIPLQSKSTKGKGKNEKTWKEQQS